MKRYSTLNGHHLAIATGGVVIAAAANFTIMKTGGWFTTNAIVTAALGLALFVSALVAGTAWRTAIVAGVAMIAGMVATEAYNLFVTAETSMIARAEQIAPLLQQAQKRADLKQRIDELTAREPASPRLTLAKKALEDVNNIADTPAVKLAQDALSHAQAAVTDSPAVTIAQAALDKARAAVEDEAQNIGCRKECWRKQDLADKADKDLKDALRTAATDQAKRIERAKVDVQAALAAAATDQAKRATNAKAEVQTALNEAIAAQAAELAQVQAALTVTPEPPVSPTLFADKTGFADWTVDIIAALLRSLALNLLGASLIAFGAAGLQVGQSGDSAEAEMLRRTFENGLPEPDGHPKVADVIRPDFRPRKQGGPGPSGGMRSPDRPKRPGPSGGLTKSQALDNLMQRLSDGRTIDSQQALADEWGCPKTTVSDWMREWRRIGVVPAAVRSGRCNATIPA